MEIGSDRKLRVLDLFSGIGGFPLGLERTSGFYSVAFCESDLYCQKVLAKHWPGVPIYDDIQTLTGARLRADGIVSDVITGGPPCQPTSLAGQRRGTADDRWLWPETLRLLAEVRPKWAVFENPCGILTLEQGVVFERLCAEMEGEGYAIQTFIIPACGVGAPHLRYRAWIIANSDGKRCKESYFANLTEEKEQFDRCSITQWAEWDTQPTVCGMDARIPHRLDRIRGLGNSVVPQIVTMLGYAILEAEQPF